MTLPFSDDVRRLNPGLQEIIGAKTVPASKYFNAKAEAKGMTFSSGHEAAVISGLILAEQQKKIFGLRLQVGFPLPGNTVYRADAIFLDEQLKVHIVDAKAFDVKTGKYRLTEAFKIKRRQFEEKYGQGIELL